MNPSFWCHVGKHGFHDLLVRPTTVSTRKMGLEPSARVRGVYLPQPREVAARKGPWSPVSRIRSFVLTPHGHFIAVSLAAWAARQGPQRCNGLPWMRVYGIGHGDLCQQTVVVSLGANTGP